MTAFWFVFRVVVAIWATEALWFAWHVRGLVPVAAEALLRRVRRWRGGYDSY